MTAAVFLFLYLCRRLIHNVCYFCIDYAGAASGYADGKWICGRHYGRRGGAGYGRLYTISISVNATLCKIWIPRFLLFWFPAFLLFLDFCFSTFSGFLLFCICTYLYSNSCRSNHYLHSSLCKYSQKTVPAAPDASGTPKKYRNPPKISSMKSLTFSPIVINSVWYRNFILI